MARPSAVPSTRRYANGERSHSSLAISSGRSPVASNRPAMACAAGVVMECLKEPVSVTRPAYRQVATSRSIVRPSRFMSSSTTIVVEAAAGSTRWTVPKPVFDTWWSITTSSPALPAWGASRPNRSIVEASKVIISSGSAG